MKPFLSQVAENLWKLHGEQLSDMRIVFPNKRSALYFTNYLKEQITTTTFRMPECLTINELFVRYSDKVVADKLSLISRLYQVYQKVTGSKERFPEFYPFANLLLGDFDAIDKHLVEVKQLFRNIASLQAVDTTFSYLTEQQLAAIKQFWSSFDVAKHSSQQQFFLQMWQALPKVYEEFNAVLDDNGIAYEGRIFREVVEKWKQSGTPAMNHVFIGFNVLSKAERELFRLLQKQGRASFYWDYASYFIANKHNEAGRFISKHIADFPCPSSFTFDSETDMDKKVTHISCNTEVQQAKIVGEILQKASKEEVAKTVIVLSNEELLPTFLASLPETLTSVNISMGYPLHETACVQFMELLMQLHQSTVWEGKTAYFSSEIVQKLLQHQYAKYIDKENVAQLEKEIQSTNKTRLSAGRVRGKLRRVLSPIFNEKDTYAYLKVLLSYLFAKSQPNSADREMLLRTSVLAQRIHEILQQVAAQEATFFWKLLLQELAQQRMPFQNSNEKGLQIIGFLESRLLDFENVYILSANESYLPNISLAGSLIPYNLRIGSGLPTIEEQNSMYAYYFYRLLSRARKMTLFSVSGSEAMQLKEQSRYITQLQHEAPFKIEELTAYAALDWVVAKPALIEKNEAIQAEFERYFTGEVALSASAINRYLRCPQNFYYRYIKGVQEVRSLAKADDSNMFGTLFHKAAELLYQPYVGEEISIGLLQKLNSKEHLQQLVLTAFETELFGNEKRELRGKEWLIFDTLQLFLERLLAKDSRYAPFVIVGLEKKMEHSLDIVVGGKHKRLVLRGLIDRIDEKYGVIRIVDYKTGAIKRNFLDLEHLFIPCDKYRNPTALQTFLYSWIFYKNTGKVPSPCVYQIKELQKDIAAEFKMGTGRKGTPFLIEAYMEEYEQLLQKLLAEIFGNETVFYPTDNEDECAHDAHTGICKAFGM